VKILLLSTAVGSILVAGVFFAFSSFIMAALARVPANSGISAMQAINVTVVNPVFMAVLFGVGLVSVVVFTLGVRSHGFDFTPTILGALVYLIGVIGVTIVFNVPLNDGLANLDAVASTSTFYWHDYLKNWTAWNHVRCLSALVAGVLYLR
jgi:uncharacterized membrane protein